MYVPLAGLVDATTNPWALAVLIVGLLASFAIAAGPPLRQFIRDMPAHARALRVGAIETARDPERARRMGAAIVRLPRAAIAYGLIGITLAGWAAYAFTQPATQTRTVARTQLEHVTSIGYVARGAPSVALPDGSASPVSAESVAQTGGQPPLYSAVLTNIDFAFQYEMRSEEPLEVLGVGGSALRIKAQDGWERTITPQPAQLLSGPQVTMWFTVDLDTVRLVIAGVEFATGSQSDWYDLTVIPVVRLAGEQGGAHIDQTYSREFNLRYDRVRITPDADFQQTERKTQTTQVEQRQRVGAFGISMELAFARWVAVIGAMIALSGAALLVSTRPRGGVTSAAIAAQPSDQSRSKTGRPPQAPAPNAPVPVPAPSSAGAPTATSAASVVENTTEASNSNAIANELSLLAARVASQASGDAQRSDGPMQADSDERASA